MENITTNSSVVIVPFHWAHVHMMDLRPFEKQYFEWFDDYNEYLKFYATQPYSYSALLNGEIACCWGINTVFPHVGEGWLLTSYLVERNPISLTRSAARYISQTAIKMKLHRLQFVVDDSNLLAKRWAEALKFEREGLLKQYGPDKSDHIMYARYYE